MVAFPKTSASNNCDGEKCSLYTDGQAMAPDSPYNLLTSDSNVNVFHLRLSIHPSLHDGGVQWDLKFKVGSGVISWIGLWDWDIYIRMTTRTQIRQLATHLGGNICRCYWRRKYGHCRFLFFCIYAWFGSLGFEGFSFFCTMIGIWLFVDIGSSRRVWISKKKLAS